MSYIVVIMLSLLLAGYCSIFLLFKYTIVYSFVLIHGSLPFLHGVDMTQFCFFDIFPNQNLEGK
jgi:hypothetical protein